MERIPVSIVTGALGSGKTTLLNYLLTEHHGVRIGVIVNEFGDVGIDSHLIEASEDDIIELPNGCVCCTVRGDLIAAVEKTLGRDVAYVLIETSGLAEPAPVANTFLAPELPSIRERTRLDGIIAVVDAEHLAEQSSNETTRMQIAAADVVLLNKTDLVSPERLARCELAIKELSPRTYVFRTVRGRAPLSVLLATGRFDIDRWVEQGWDKREEHAHEGYDALALAHDAPLRLDAISTLVRALPVEIFRAKGILCVGNAADPRPEKDVRMVFQKVGRRVETHFSRSWRDGEPHQTRIVLIGKGIDRERWQRELDACALARKP
jgi:G3E family GTPase